MAEMKKKDTNPKFVYQPKNKPHRNQFYRIINEGYQPSKPISSQPPDRGSNVQPAKKEK